MRKLKIAAGVLVALLLLVKFVLLTAADLPPKARFALDLEALRTAAGPQEALPQSAHAEQVARFETPWPVVMAGGPFSMATFGFYVWQLRYPDGSTAILDPVHGRKTQEKQQSGAPYDDAAWERQEKAIAQAKVIAVTHEHFDHLGGAAESAHFASFGDKLKLNAAQRKKPGFGAVDRDLSGPATLESGPEGSLHPVAPGIVAISTPGHTPGSQLFYVRLAGGEELLLIGDVAWQEANLEQQKNRARLTGMLAEDSEAIAHQMRAILDFKASNPKVDVVVAHDIPAMERRFASGSVGKGL